MILDMTERQRIAFTCSYTPLPLIHAAGFTPYRVLPMGAAPDQAGTLLHDNMCPEVKRVLDRKLAGDLPDLAGAVFVNSCDAMRRLSHAWCEVDSPGRTHLMDLPVMRGDAALAYLTAELGRLREQLQAWSGAPIEDDVLRASIGLYDELRDKLVWLGQQAAAGQLPGGRAMVQEWSNRAVCGPPDQVLQRLNASFGGAWPAIAADDDVVPVALFGNVLPDPDALELIESCGARIVADDLCTGSRQLARVGPLEGGEPLAKLASALLDRPLCARTVVADDLQALPTQVLELVTQSGARGAVAQVVKFCDPYLLRLPAIREAFQAAGVPLLVLEGDCTLRSLGQQRTRIEAFVEMLRGAS